MKKDLIPAVFPSLQWSAEQRRDALDRLCTWVIDKAQDAIVWYFAKKTVHQILCRTFRVTSILLAALSAILPLINEVSGYGLHPLWSAIALAVAATLVLLDRFYGFTSGWIRFMLAGQQLVQLLEDFRLEIERQKLCWQDPDPTRQESLQMLNTIRAFLDQTQAILARETRQWASEFSAVLKQIDEQLRLKQPGTQAAGTAKP